MIRFLFLSILFAPVLNSQILGVVFPLAIGANVSNAAGSRSALSNVLAPAMLARLTDPNINSITSISIRPANTQTAIPVNVVTSGQDGTTFIVPAGVPYGTAQLIWQIPGGQFHFLPVTIARSNFELAAHSPDTLAQPALPGQIETLSGSGLGYGNDVTATLGGVPASVISSGRSLVAGMDQIQIRIPEGVSGCFVPLSIMVGSQTILGNTLSVSSDGSPCQDPSHFSPADLSLLDKGGMIAVAELSVDTSLLVPTANVSSRSESVYLSVTRQSESFFTGDITQSAASCLNPSVVRVPTAAFRVGDFSSGVGTAPPVPPTLGKTVTLQNGNASIALNESSVGYYSSSLPAPRDGAPTNFPVGKWTLTLPASSDVPASTFTFNLSTPLQLNGGAPISLHRDRDESITWNGANLDPNSSVTLFISTSTGFVNCAAPASAGSIVIPANLLAQFSPASIGTITASLQQPRAAHPSVLLKTNKGETLVLYVAPTSGDTRPVDFQ
jgi:uncharacterized protein (TIGR03437 family)